jgi:hypothetical protein
MEMNTKNVIPLRTYQLELIRTIDDMEWEGEDTEAQRLELERVMQRLEDGDLWETTF